ncbi:hypothetical protein B1T17_004605 [Salmonella enterica subsp. enterica serovar Bredeney]|nr:hypothetical protein [Salmonella enterica subsp. enterica serovar Bredeney]EDT4986369.1 hypothetical protein [Salmonella enterica subsp. enterica serovar Bredeney]EDW3195528.1 hypothetical protein [Salmonella enterica]
MGSCAAPSAKGDDKFITTDYLQQCRKRRMPGREQQNCDKSLSTFQIKCDEPPLNL